MKARSANEIRRIEVFKKKFRGDHPKDDGFPHYNCNPTWWCVPCRKSFKHGPTSNGEFGHCPLCRGPLEAHDRHPVPWSKKGRRYLRRNRVYKGKR
jgi:hypothetical protein